MVPSVAPRAAPLVSESGCGLELSSRTFRLFDIRREVPAARGGASGRSSFEYAQTRLLGSSDRRGRNAGRALNDRQHKTGRGRRTRHQIDSRPFSRAGRTAAPQHVGTVRRRENLGRGCSLPHGQSAPTPPTYWHNNPPADSRAWQLTAKWRPL